MKASHVIPYSRVKLKSKNGIVIAKLMKPANPEIVIVEWEDNTLSKENVNNLDLVILKGF